MTRFLLLSKYPQYLMPVFFLYLEYSKFLDDDYAQDKYSMFEYFLNLVNELSSFFWVILHEDEVSGFVYLDKMIGDSENFHSAELSTCFSRKFWGDYTKMCARLFLDFCFENFGFYKIKALVYPDNFRVKTLLKASGFEKEALLKSETLRNGKLQDIEVYSVIRKGEKNENRN